MGDFLTRNTHISNYVRNVKGCGQYLFFAYFRLQPHAPHPRFFLVTTLYILLTVSSIKLPHYL